jgi:thioredoxin reductase (NADPH)
MSEKIIHDIIIIGAGPAGLTAALYSGRALLDTVIVEARGPGGQVILTHEIENYPGFVEPVSGAHLAANMLEQSVRFGVKLVSSPVDRMDLAEPVKVIHTADGPVYGKTVILATGVNPKLLGATGEKEYVGRGVSYCATCDGAFFRNREVAVIGGGDTAVKEAIFLTKFASKVWLVHRRNQLRAEPIQRQRMLANEKITPIWNTVVREIKGDGKRVTALGLENLVDGATQELPVGGVFIFVGRQPMGPLAGSGLHLDNDGHLITDEEMHTNIPGVFAVGDVRSKRWRQIATAVGDGCTAALSAAEYIEENFKEE